MRVTELKEELRERGMSPVGNKEALLARLAADQKHGSVKLPSPNQSPHRVSDPAAHAGWQSSPAKPKKLSPVKKTLVFDESSSATEQDESEQENIEAHQRRAMSSSGRSLRKRSRSATPSRHQSPVLAGELSYRRTPLKIVTYATVYAADQARAFVYSLTAAQLTSWLLSLAAALTLLLIDATPQLLFLENFRRSFLWYSYWFVLGLLASVGLGSSANTFRLYLAPFLARVTQVASTCKSVDFSVFGPSAMKCTDTRVPIDMLSIFVKVYFEIFAWTTGTVVGDLVYYVLGRFAHSAAFRHDAGWIGRVKRISRTFLSRAGSSGIVLLSAFPSCFSELSALASGYFDVPFDQFAFACFGGRLASTLVQSIFVIFIFSDTHAEGLLKQLPQWKSLHLTELVQRFIKNTRALIVSRFYSITTVQILWQSMVVAVTVYVFLEALLGAAQSHPRRLKRA